MVSIPSTLGALFIGGFVAAVFSGVVCSQAFAYFKNYPNDSPLLKALAAVVWCETFGIYTMKSALDTGLVAHNLACALWDHLISHFGQGAQVDYIPWSLAISIAFTATLTILVHLLLIHRIYKRKCYVYSGDTWPIPVEVSHGNHFISFPLVLLACARLCFACLTTAKMIQLRSLAQFVRLYKFSFTSGLALSSGLDVLITSSLCLLLYKNRKDQPTTNHILDKLTLYTFENGLLTCNVAFTSLICWLTNKNNLVFMGLHFVMSKFYANTFFATLNTRRLVHTGRGHRTVASNGSGLRNIPVAVYPADLSLERKKSSLDVHTINENETKMQHHSSVQVHVRVEKTETMISDIPLNQGESTSATSNSGDKEIG